MQKIYNDDYVYFTLDVVILCSAERLYSFVKDPWNLEKWTQVFREIRHHEANVFKFSHDYLGYGQNMDGYFTIVANEQQKTVDYYWGDTPGDWWGFASSRVVAFADRSLYVFTLFRNKQKLPSKYLDTDTKIIDEELAILKSVLETTVTKI